MATVTHVQHMCLLYIHIVAMTPVQHMFPHVTSTCVYCLHTSTMTPVQHMFPHVTANQLTIAAMTPV